MVFHMTMMHSSFFFLPAFINFIKLVHPYVWVGRGSSPFFSIYKHQSLVPSAEELEMTDLLDLLSSIRFGLLGLLCKLLRWDWLGIVFV